MDSTDIKIIDSKESNVDDATDNKKSELIGHWQSGLLAKLGMKTNESTIKKASNKTIEKLYSEYENRYNTHVADDLVSNLLYGYTQCIKYVFPNLNEKRLHEKLNVNVIINNEMKKQLGNFINPSILAVGTLAANTSQEIMNASGINTETKCANPEIKCAKTEIECVKTEIESAMKI